MPPRRIINFRTRPVVYWNFHISQPVQSDPSFDISESQEFRSIQYIFLVVGDQRNRVRFGEDVIAKLRDYGSVESPQNIVRGSVKDSKLPYSCWEVDSTTNPTLLERSISSIARNSGIVQVTKDYQLYHRVRNPQGLAEYVLKKMS